MGKIERTNREEDGKVILREGNSVREVSIDELRGRYNLRVGGYGSIKCIVSNLTPKEVAEYKIIYRDEVITITPSKARGKKWVN